MLRPMLCRRLLNRGFATLAPSSEPYDVVIVGGGMVGAALAALLGANPLTRDLRVALLDTKAQPSTFSPPLVPELRVSTLTPATIQSLRQAGAWGAIAPPSSASFATMQVWDAAGGGHIRWDAKDIGAESMGCVAENGLLQASLLAAAQRSAGATEFLWPATLAQLHLPGTTSSTSTSTSTSTTGGSGASSAHSPADAEGLGSATSGVALGVAVTNAGGTAFTTAVPTQSEAGSPTSASSTGAPSSAGVGDGLALLVLEDGRRLRSRLVVAADGANSQVRRLAGLRTFGWDYHQRGVVAAVATESPHSTAWQAFLPTGPLALLPTRGGLSNIVWSTDPAAARRLEAMSPIEFAAAADAALQAGAGAGAVRPPRVISCPGSGPVRSFPLRSQHVGVYVLPRLALIGDAAHAVHPLAGQGVNLGFGDAVALADALAAAKQCGQDVGDVLLLEEQYQVPRQRAVMAMAAALDGVKGAFAVQAGPLAALRSLGLGALNWAGPVKNRVMKFAMGL